MANEEHLAILQQGVDAWNGWRRKNPSIIPDLREANLTGMDLTKIDFILSDLAGATLANVDLYKAVLVMAVFISADLTGADLSMADCTRADFTDANLTQTTFQGTNFRGADLRGADLRASQIRGADLTNANLAHAKLAHATAGITTFGNLDLSEVYGLDSIKHTDPSTLGIDTLYRSQGNIPAVFLRGCGVPDSMITYARSFVAAQRPIDYYSVFISYSSRDQALAERLYADLQAKGVRCWLAPHDLTPGEVIVRGIDEAIRLHDKVVLLLSEAAVTSHWVAYEVNLATTREAREGRTVLYPIRLDDTMLHTSSGWAAQLRSRHIGDFRGWKDHDHYQAAFTRLLRDLKSHEGSRKE